MFNITVRINEIKRYISDSISDFSISDSIQTVFQYSEDNEGSAMKLISMCDVETLIR